MRGELADRDWERLFPLFPPQKPRAGRRGRQFDQAVYRARNHIERLINLLKQFRRVATRYEKRADNYQAMLTIAAIKLWLQFANRP